MKSILQKRYKKLKPIKNNKSQPSSASYEVEINFKLFVKEIKKNDEKILINNEIKLNRIKIFDKIEEKETLYIITDKENLEEVEKLLINNKNSKIIEEGVLSQNIEPIIKKEVDELFRYENSMCKIKYEIDNLIKYGSGFFCEIDDNDIPFKVALFTCNHIINEDHINNSKIINLEYMNEQKEIKITGERRIYTDKFWDYTCIEIIETDNIINFKEIKNLLKVEANALKNNYPNKQIFILQYPKGDVLAFSSGKILTNDNGKLMHTASTLEGSSGSPLITKFSKSCIGIHKGFHENILCNIGISFDLIIDNIKNKIYKNNMIISEIEINEVNLSSNIINSYENAIKEGLKFDDSSNKVDKNEEEIKNCIIEINGKRLNNFQYNYTFKEKGIYTIKYKFPKLLKSTNFMFYNCQNLTNLDLSNLDTKQCKNMCGMFSGCMLLKEIKMSNINTEQVHNMSWMFNECTSLKDLNISNFNTNNVTNMSYMFTRCSSLNNLNILNLNTQNVTNTSEMFWGCKSLTKLNLEHFKTQNLVNMERMFFGCSSLKDLDLSSFTTNKVTNMEGAFAECFNLINLKISTFSTENVINMKEMFFRCKSLQSLDLSNFNTKNIEIMDGLFADCDLLESLNLLNFNTDKISNLHWLFSGCLKLKKHKIITKNKKILNQLLQS